MTCDEIKKILALLGLVAIAGCGGGDKTNEVSGMSVTGAGMLSVSIANTKTFNPAIKHGEIDRYEVKIEGTDISPIVKEFPGDVTEGVIENIPVGAGRTVSVAASNKNHSIIRAGEVLDVEVGGDATRVSVELESVPIFTNITEKGVIDNTRLVFHVFSDPTHPVSIEDSSESNSGILANATTGVTEILSDESTGVGRLSPQLLPSGAHRFIVRDRINGRYSEVNVILADGTKKRPAPLAAAGASTTRNTSKANWR